MFRHHFVLVSTYFLLLIYPLVFISLLQETAMQNTSMSNDEGNDVTAIAKSLKVLEIISIGC